MNSIVRKYWLLIFYIATLLIGMLLFMILPEPSSMKALEQHHLAEGNRYMNDYQVIEGEVPIEDLAEFKRDSQTFTYTNEQLHINTSVNTKIIIERKEMADDLIEAAVYQEPIIAKGFDVTEYIEPIKISLSGDRLHINDQSTTLKLAAIGHEAVFQQFSTRKAEDDRSYGGDWVYTSSISIGTEMVYLKVPRNLKIADTEYMDIHFLE